MMINLKWKLLVAGFVITSCGDVALEDFSKASSEQEAELLYLDGEEASDVSEVPAELKIIREQQEKLRKEVAECAGFGEEAEAFLSDRTAVLESDESDEEKRNQMKVLHETFKIDVLEINKAEIKACRDELKDSETHEIMKSLIGACFETPEKGVKRDRKAGSFLEKAGAMLTGGEERKRKGDRKMRKKGKQGPRGLPPKEAARFDSEECQDMIESLED